MRENVELVMTAIQRFVTRATFAGLVCLVSLGAATRAEAAVITFTTEDLADTIAGQDVWRYAFSVTDETFLENFSLSLFFDSAIASSVRAIATPSVADWDALVLQPSFPGDSFVYDALALADGASLAGPFVIDIVRVPGALLPSTQMFAINQFDAAGNLLRVVSTGQAINASVVPESSSVGLLSAGLGLMLVWRRRGAARTPRRR